jgi:hypothetical protein
MVSVKKLQKSKKFKKNVQKTQKNIINIFTNKLLFCKNEYNKLKNTINISDNQDIHKLNIIKYLFIWLKLLFVISIIMLICRYIIPIKKPISLDDLRRKTPGHPPPLINFME